MLAFVVIGMSVAGFCHAQALSGNALRKALQGGGYVLVMRHANAPVALPDKTSADPDNVNLERQLDEAGRTQANAIGAGIRALKIPVGDIFTSPTYRALQTIQLAGLGRAAVVPELDEGTQGMLGGADADKAAWLREKAATVPTVGQNVLVVTHTPNIRSAFAAIGADIAPGEALVLKPDGHGSTALVARLKPADWATLAGSQ